jgi:hypothetical protein
MKALALGIGGFCGFTIVALAQPPMPAPSTVPGKCQWEWKTGGGLGVWAERCVLETGVWEPKFREDLPGFVLTIDEPGETILQRFAKPADADIAAILPELRKRGYIPDDDECIFAPAAGIGPAVRTKAFFEIVPTGKRKAAFDATPGDEVPAPPRGDYGASTHGVRYFMTELGHPESVVYINIGQDGMMFDPDTVTLE